MTPLMTDLRMLGEAKAPSGFADRVIAMELANLFPEVRNRSQARAMARGEAGAVRAALAEYPSYFSAVLDEVTAG